MAKDRSKRAWSINRAQAETFPKPKPKHRHGHYKGTGGTLIDGHVPPSFVPSILHMSRQGIGYDNFYDAPRVRPAHEPYIPDYDKATGLPCVKGVARDRQYAHNPNKFVRYKPEPHVIKPSKRRRFAQL